MGSPLTVITWLWTGAGAPWGRFKIEHVNRCARMIRANLAIPHEIVCITDLSDSGAPYFDSDIRLIPLWSDLSERGRCWRRLKTFAPEMKDVIGERWAWIDLDCVVLADLGPLFDRTEDLVLWRSQSTRNPYNGSIVLHRSGTMPEIWQKYSPSIQIKYPGSDQAWLAHLLGPNMPVWTDADGVHAYNRRPRRWRDGPQDGARIIFFPGSIKSNSHIVQRTTPWIQKILNQYGDFDEPSYRWHPRAHRAMSRKEARFARGGRTGVVARE